MPNLTFIDEVGYILCPNITDICGKQEHDMYVETEAKFSSKKFNQSYVWVYKLDTSSGYITNYNLSISKLHQCSIKILTYNIYNSFTYLKTITSTNHTSIINIAIEYDSYSDVYLVAVPTGSSAHVEFTAGSIAIQPEYLDKTPHKSLAILAVLVIIIVGLVVLLCAVGIKKYR